MIQYLNHIQGKCHLHASEIQAIKFKLHALLKKPPSNVMDYNY
jgi:hypothetical protein